MLQGDVKDIAWEDLSNCKGIDTEYFFDEYETNEQVRAVVDEMCLSCNVFKQCLEFGTTNGQWGVWGSCYLVAGKPDKARNAHKSKETWDRVRARIDS